MNEITVNKLNIENFMQNLYDLHVLGAEWVDIKISVSEDEGQRIYFLVRKDYMKDYKPEEEVPLKLTADIIRQLIL